MIIGSIADMALGTLESLVGAGKSQAGKTSQTSTFSDLLSQQLQQKTSHAPPDLSQSIGAPRQSTAASGIIPKTLQRL